MSDEIKYRTEHRCQECGTFMHDGGPVGLYCVDDQCNARERKRIFDAFRAQGFGVPKVFDMPKDDAAPVVVSPSRGGGG